jgi:hypothetical protein
VLAFAPVLGLVAHLRAHEPAIVAQWHSHFAQNRLRFSMAVDPAEYQVLVAGLVEATALAAYGGFARSIADAREVERVAAFVGATFATEPRSERQLGGPDMERTSERSKRGPDMERTSERSKRGPATTFDVGALMSSVHHAISAQVSNQDAKHALSELFAWLTLVACHAFASAKELALREQQADELASGTPVMLVAHRLPVLAMVASPTKQTAYQVMSRALMVALAASAPRLVIHVDGLSPVGFAAMAGGLEAIQQHGLTTLTYMICGESNLAKQLFRVWQTHLGDRVSYTNEIFVGIRDSLAALG